MGPYRRQNSDRCNVMAQLKSSHRRNQRVRHERHQRPRHCRRKQEESLCCDREFGECSGGKLAVGSVDSDSKERRSAASIGGTIRCTSAAGRRPFTGGFGLHHNLCSQSFRTPRGDCGQQCQRSGRCVSGTRARRQGGRVVCGQRTACSENGVAVYRPGLAICGHGERLVRYRTRLSGNDRLLRSSADEVSLSGPR